VPLIHTYHAASLPSFDSAVSFVKARVVAGNIRTVATLPLSEPRPTTTTGHDTICCKNLSLTLLKMGENCPKHVELILEINKLLLLHLVGFLYITLPTFIMHGQTQIKFSQLKSISQVIQLI